MTAPSPSTHSSAQEILALARTGGDTFAAGGGDANHIGTIYGGRMLAQGLLSAVETVSALPPSSLHAYFLAPARVAVPIEYRVQRLRDTRRFAHRLVTAVQEERSIFVLMAQFHAPEHGFDRQDAIMPDVPPPEEVQTLQHFVRENEHWLDAAAMHNFSGPVPVEMRPIDPEAYFRHRSQRASRSFWFRVPGALAVDDPRSHACLLAYASDYWLAGVAATPHIFPTNGKDLLLSSLDHAVWFHRPARHDDWLLHHCSSPSARDGLALAQGRIFDRQGRLVASTSQECLMRSLGPPRSEASSI